jgi:hypothetical protein
MPISNWWSRMNGNEDLTRAIDELKDLVDRRNKFEEEVLKQLAAQTRVLRVIAWELRRKPNQPILSEIRIQFTEPQPSLSKAYQSAFIGYYPPTPPTKGALPAMPSTVGPVTLNQGQSTIASVQGFDQFGNPMPADFVIPPVTFSIDNSTIASSTPNADGVTDAIVGLTGGVANLTATVQGPNGPLSDVETVTVVASPPPTPVLSSIKIAFSTPA